MGLNYNVLQTIHQFLADKINANVWQLLLWTPLDRTFFVQHDHQVFDILMISYWPLLTDYSSILIKSIHLNFSANPVQTLQIVHFRLHPRILKYIFWARSKNKSIIIPMHFFLLNVHTGYEDIEQMCHGDFVSELFLLNFGFVTWNLLFLLMANPVRFLWDFVYLLKFVFLFYLMYTSFKSSKILTE